MKRQSYILVALLLFLVSCHKPTDIALEPSVLNSEIEIEPAGSVDLNLERFPVDSSALTPAEMDRYAGRILLNNIKHDKGRGVLSNSFSKVLFEHRNRPIIIGNKKRGFWGIPVGTVRLNGTMMPERPHRVAGFNAGVEYILELDTLYKPNTNYTWLAASDSVGALAASIESPGDIQVRSPKGGTTVSRDNDLLLRWSGQGNLSIVLSRISVGTTDVKPLLYIKVKGNTGQAVLSKRVLRALPSSGQYVFSFVLSNRDETVVPSRFGGRVLVQAASVYNSFIELQ